MSATQITETTITTTIDQNQQIPSKSSAQNQLNKQKHFALNDQEINTKKSHTTSELVISDKNSKNIGNMSSNTAGQATSKTGNKVSIDHQATLDKGLKMKIKRTKPGTKTSEAKHEIVKAEQNGSLSGADDSNSSSSGNSSGNKKMTLQQQNQPSIIGQQQQQQTQPPVANQLQTNSSSTQQLSPNST